MESKREYQHIDNGENTSLATGNITGKESGKNAPMNGKPSKLQSIDIPRKPAQMTFSTASKFWSGRRVFSLGLALIALTVSGPMVTSGFYSPPAIKAAPATVPVVTPIPVSVFTAISGNERRHNRGDHPTGAGSHRTTRAPAL